MPVSHDAAQAASKAVRILVGMPSLSRRIPIGIATPELGASEHGVLRLPYYEASALWRVRGWTVQGDPVEFYYYATTPLLVLQLFQSLTREV